jgi:hypothetical protein
MKRIKLKGGDEYDVHTRWRQVVQPSLSILRRAKKAYNKRFRKDGKNETRELE